MSVTKLRKLLKQHGFSLKTRQQTGHAGDGYLMATIVHVETGCEWGRVYLSQLEAGTPPAWKAELMALAATNLALFNDALGELRRDIQVLGDLRDLVWRANAQDMKQKQSKGA